MHRHDLQTLTWVIYTFKLHWMSDSLKSKTQDSKKEQRTKAAYRNLKNNDFFLIHILFHAIPNSHGQNNRSSHMCRLHTLQKGNNRHKFTKTLTLMPSYSRV